ncbi:MAG: HAMP domain-containing histidine kinase [Labilithrix sp.]|nr:HAMP domain-containing histidine kinase [Labilithrix sp.]
MKPRSSKLPTAASFLWRCALAFAITAAAVGLAQALWSETPPSPFLLFYPAVVLAAWWGGWITAALTVALSMLALLYFFLPPTDSIVVASKRDALDLSIFCGVSLLLTHFLTRMRRALERAREALRLAETANAAKETVLAVVAHDLRNPLQTIVFATELLARETYGDRPESLHLARIRRCSLRARRLVDNILDSARIGAHPFPIAMSSCSLADLVDDALAPFEPIAGARSIRLVLPDASAVAGSLVCDRDRIIQVLSNLVGNSLQYTPRDGTVSVRVERRPNGVQFTVTDTGCGMTREELNHAFERLWHGQQPGHGSGLGLWIARALVEAHGGKLEATSAPGKGTTMTFLLPERSPDEAQAAPEAPPLVPAHA